MLECFYQADLYKVLEMKKKALEIKNVTIIYSKKKEIVSNIDLSIDEGMTYALVGLNGEGKTTIIKSILGLREVDNGVINVFGLSPFDNDAKSRFAYLPEKFDPPSFLTGYEFLEFSLSVYGKKTTKEDIVKSAQSLALDSDCLDKKVQTYSKGMRQKLGILGTFLTDCDLIILDEPMSGLDPMARKLVKKMILAYKKKGRTILLSSHILPDMKEICDSIFVINKAKICFNGTPDEMMALGRHNDMEEAFMNIISM